MVYHRQQCFAAKMKSSSSTRRPSVQSNVAETSRPKQLTVKTRSPSESTHTVDVSSTSSSSTSLYVEEVPLGVVPPSNAKLFLPCEDSASQSKAKKDRAKDIEKEREEFWNNYVISRSVSLGPRHLRTAEALMELGSTQLAAGKYTTAGRTYLSALKIFQAIYGDKHLSVARALDKVGLTASMSRAYMDLALSALTDGLKIRCELLGADHIDSVDSLNNVAGVRLNRGEFSIATQHYKTVLRRREQIFGRYHAAVAVTAYTLACVLDDRLDDGREAYAHFRLAAGIYEFLGLTESPYYVDTLSRLQEHAMLSEI